MLKLTYLSEELSRLLLEVVVDEPLEEEESLCSLLDELGVLKS